jgi:S-adenosylmethionine:diacylglycerol 3-amino-3-carboxypropyl transferase
MKRLQGALNASGNETKLISLRSLSAVQDMDAFVAMETDKPKALMLDALDEAPLATLSAVWKEYRRYQESSRIWPSISQADGSSWKSMRIPFPSIAS